LDGLDLVQTEPNWITTDNDAENELNFETLSSIIKLDDLQLMKRLYHNKEHFLPTR